MPQTRTPKAGNRPATRPTTRKKAVIRPPSPAEVAAGRVAAAQAARLKAWAGLAPQTVGRRGRVEVHAVAVPGPHPHWHLVTVGLAPRGLELSLRVDQLRDEAEPPTWAVARLVELIAEAVAGTLAAGQCLSVGPLDGVGATALTGFVLGADPKLATAEAEATEVAFLTAVGVTADEARIVREWSPESFLALLAQVDPLLVTDRARPSLLSSPRARAVIEERAWREGSALGTLVAKTSNVTTRGRRITWRLDRDAADAVGQLLRSRLGHLRPFTVASQSSRVDLVPGEAPHAEASGTALTLTLPLPFSQAMRATLKPDAGAYRWEGLPHLTIEVVRS